MYVVYLDSQVRARFEGARWSLPAKVYASPMELFEGQDLGAAELVSKLERKGYRRTSGIESSGTYRRRGGSVDVHTRPFIFWDGRQAARTLRVRFSGQAVQGLEPLDDGKDPALLRLDPRLIGSIYPAGKGEDRILVKLGEVPPMLPAGLIVVEDRNFLDHYGVSPKGILRAAWANLRAGDIVQGGSTLTQQLIKNFYLNNEQTLARKAKEALMAVLLDAHYGKEAILEAYLNEVYLGQDGGRAIHGFGLASYTYFDKPVAELQPHEIAMLIGMVKGPSYYDPRDHPERTRARRNLVLDIFEKADLLSREEANRARGESLGLTDSGSRETTEYPAFIDLVRQQLHGQYRDEALTTDGLRIFTTVDPDIQATTQQRATDGLRELERSKGLAEGALQTAAVVTSVEGGRVLALVGGRDAEYAGFNRAIEAERPIGSLMKPVVYLSALDRPGQYNVLTPLDDTELAVELPTGKTWRPQNYSRESHGRSVPLHEALTHSYNVATARLALALDLPNVVSTLEALGYEGDPAPLPSLALGAVEMSPLEVAQIYNTLAAGGYYKPLRAIRAVTTREGEPLNRYSLQMREAYSEQSVYLLNWVLQRVTRHGTARSAYYTLPDSLQVAGKTGTTNDQRDSWFAGFGANRVAAVWVGRDNNKPTPFTGATGALQTWSAIMRDIGTRSYEPQPPRAVETIRLVLDRYAKGAPPPEGMDSRVWEDCSKAIPIPFMAGHVPDDLQPCEQARSKHSDARDSDEDGGSNWFKELFQ